MLDRQHCAIDFTAEQDTLFLEFRLILLRDKLTLERGLESLNRPDLINSIPHIIVANYSIVLVVDQVHGQFRVDACLVLAEEDCPGKAVYQVEVETVGGFVALGCLLGVVFEG